jgi:hypothetical protein
MAKVKAPIFTDSFGCSAENAIAVSREKAAATGAVFMRKDNQELRKNRKEICAL